MSESESMSVQEEPEVNQSSLDPVEEEQFEPIPENEEPEILEEHVSSSEEAALSSEHATSHEHEKGGKEGFSSQFELFRNLFNEYSDPEAKLQLAVDFMESALGQGGTPHFRSFWEARKYCLPLFKENISVPLRGHLWTKYSELSKEARRLKELLDEQSAFAVEQIEIAIQALENDIANYEELINKGQALENIVFPVLLKDTQPLYQDLQTQLNVLNVQASRINALRKELLKTEMRVRQKNKFFQRLSTAGDQVFPKRKELIKQISQQFSDDINRFIETHFSEEPSGESLYVLREEIKALQGLAKVLTLNTHSFTQTRTRLSDCWDKIKSEEKERKKERAQQRVLFRQNGEEIHQTITELKEQVEKNEISSSEIVKKIDQIVLHMRKTELGREELKVLRDALGDVRKLMQAKTKAEEEARHHEENERNRLKKERYLVFKSHAENLVRNHETLESVQLISERDTLLQEVQDSNLTKIEKLEIDRLLKPLRDIIADKKEKEVLDLSEDDRQTLNQLQNILKQRKERRLEVETQLKALRKSASSSGLDFEKAINLNTQITEEEERLDKSILGIKEIQNKISELQTRIRAGLKSSS